MVGKKFTMDDKTDKLSKQNQQQKNDIFNYNLDHVYCSDNSNYRNASGINNSGSSANDLKTLRKENKQLQAMLLLHLDLIQEQSNQLISKDKQLLQLREEKEQLRLRCERSERRSKGNAGGTGIGAGNANSPTIDTYFSVENSAVHNRLDDKAKQSPQTATKQVISVTADDKLLSGSGGTNKDRNRNNNDVHSNRSTPITIGYNKERLNAPPTIKYRGANDGNHTSNVIGNNNGKLISKIILQRKQSETGEKIFVKAKNVNVENSKANEDASQAVIAPLTIASSATSEKSIEVAIKKEVIDVNEALPVVRTRNDQEHNSSSDCVIDPNYAKASIKIEKDFDERSAQRPTNTPPPPPPPPEGIKLVLSSPKIILNPVKTEAHGKRMKYYVKSSTEKATSSSSSSSNSMLSSNASNAMATMIAERTPSTSSSNGTIVPNVFARRQSTRQSYLTTKKAYMTREWQLDEIEMEVNQLITDEPCKDAGETLEIPKWKTWEFSNTRDPSLPHHRDVEDISEDAYVRRHAKFLMDERKRKKWDVQRIREQRTIERLKRRHCKDELNQQVNDNEIVSFFPPAENLKAILITDDLPVSAFGELIPALPATEFTLPWHRSHNTNVIISDNATPSTSTHSGAAAAANIPQIKITAESTSSASSLIFLSKRRAGRAKQMQPTTSNYKSAL